jgi:methyl-accepting chemotaxis protein
VTDPTEQKRPKIRRRQYVVDKRMQLGVMVEVLGVTAMIGLLYYLAAKVFLSEDATYGLSANEVRLFLIRMNGLYFMLASFIIAVLMILVMHRVAGPVYVLKNAIKSIRRGEFDCRLTLRRRDHLKDLAEALSELRDDLASASAARTAAAGDLAACLEENDLDGARAALARIRGEPMASTRAARETASTAAG